MEEEKEEEVLKKEKEVFKVGKKNGILYFENIHSYETRNNSTFKCIEEANKIYQWSDFDITIHTGDTCQQDEYGYSKNSLFRLVPDFNFDAWPQVGIHDYTETIQKIKRAGSFPAQLLKVGWIGNTDTNEMRKILALYGNKYPRLFDIMDMKWIQGKNTQLGATKFLSIPDLIKRYAIVIDIEGYGYSGRLKHLLWSRRPLLLVDRPHKEYFFENLKEWEHYIPVKRDLSDLLLKTLWCLKNMKKAQQIANNALKFSEKYLTREACYSKWNEIITDHLKIYGLADNESQLILSK